MKKTHTHPKRPTEQEAEAAAAKREAILKELAASYSAHLDESMGKLHEQFVAFVASSQLPLPQILLVLEILVSETIEQAKNQYLGE
jgi:hypothetical protein